MIRRTLTDFRADVVYSLRALAKAPGFAAAAVVTLALGIGANAALFSVVRTLLLKPLPYTYESDRLVRLIAHLPGADTPDAPPTRATVGLTPAEIEQLRTRTRAFAALGTVAPALLGLSGRDDAGRLEGARVSASIFPLLGARARLGRHILPDDESPGRDAVVVLGQAAWQRFFGGDPRVVGTVITFETVLGPRVARPHTVVGVMPAEFAFPSDRTDFWVPVSPGAAGGPAFRGPLLGRLAEGVTIEAALAEIGPAVRALRRHGSGVRYELVREEEEIAAPVRPALIVLTGAVGFVLLIACANVANLLLARALVRRREIAVRSALGAGRGRLARQALTDSLVLAAFGGVAGIGIAFGGVRVLRTLASTVTRIDVAGGVGFPRLHEIEIDGYVLAVTAAISLASGALAAVAAVLRQSRADPIDALRTSRGAALSRTVVTPALGRALVIVQVTAGMVLLVGAALLARSFAKLATVETGYVADNVITFQVSLPSDSYPDGRLKEFAEAFAERLRNAPGVHAAAYANQLPLVRLHDSFQVRRTPPSPETDSAGRVDARFISHDYFAAMGMRIVAGRGLRESDRADQPRVVVINESLARRVFGDQHPVGLSVYIGADPVPWQVIGVVADVRQFALDRPPEPQVFVDLRQSPDGPIFPLGPYFAVRTDGDPAAVVPLVRRTARTFEPRAAVFNVSRMDALVGNSIARERLYSVLLGLLAWVGVALAAIGVYGVLAYVVASRTPEIGIRIALGATRAGVLGLVLREGLALAFAGVIAGAAVAAVLSRYLESLLFGITPLDPITYGVTSLGFAFVAAIAAGVPAWRASRVDPLDAVHGE